MKCDIRRRYCASLMRDDAQVVPDVDNQKDRNKDKQTDTSEGGGDKRSTASSSSSPHSSSLERKHTRSDEGVVLLRTNRRQTSSRDVHTQVPGGGDGTSSRPPPLPRPVHGPVIRRINRDAEPLNEDEISALARSNIVSLF